MSKSDEPPPPYSAIERPVVRNHDECIRPFSNSEQMVMQIQSLVAEGASLESRLQEILRLLSKTDSENQIGQLREPARELRRNLTTQLWACRESAGIARGAVKEFNENVLDLLAEPDVRAQVRMDELVGMWKVMRQQAELVAVQRQNFGPLVSDFDIFSRMVLRNINELTATLDHGETVHNRYAGNAGQGESSSWVRRRHTVRRHTPGMSSQTCPQRESQPNVDCISSTTGLSTQVAFGTLTYSDPTACFLKLEQCAEETLASFYRRIMRSWSGQPYVRPKKAAIRLKPELKRSQLATLHTLVDDVLRDLRTFCDRLVVFEDIFKELQREHDVLVFYIKDGQSVAHRGYKLEINRLRKHLLPLFQALGAYTKARIS